MWFGSTKIGIVAAFAAIYLVWGSTYLALALALQSFPPFFLMGTRCLVGAGLLFLVARSEERVVPSMQQWGVAVLCGMLFFVGCHGVLAFAQQRVPSGFAAILLATIPLWIVVLQAILPGETRPTPKEFGYLVVGVAGVALIAWREAAGAGSVAAFDILLLVGAALSWAAGTIFSRRQPGKLSPATMSSMELLVGGIALLLVSAQRGELDVVASASITLTALAGWLYLTLAGTLVAFGAYVWLLKKVSTTLVTTYTFVNPVIALLLGWGFMGEQLTPWMLAGTVLVVLSVSGVLLTQATSEAPTRQRLSVREC